MLVGHLPCWVFSSIRRRTRYWRDWSSDVCSSDLVISAIRVGKSGHVFVLDTPGRLIAHPDISLVLRGADDPAAKPFEALRAAILAQGGEAATGQDRSDERRVGKECRSRCSPYHYK